MKRLLFAAATSLLLGLAAFAQVLTGIDVLSAERFAPLRGKRVGLLTNPTGVDRRLNSTVDLLYAAPGVKLTALFAPEHGVRGDVAAGAKVTSGRDAKTGLPVYSLYGATKRPTPEMLQEVDIMVYDLQDIGCRSYTFISSLLRLMEACAEQQKPLMVLDRPNPLGGNRVEGPLSVDADCSSFVSALSIPYVYGLTCGELARWINGEVLGGKCPLQVIEMQGYDRSMTFAQTGLPWVPTSPNIPTAETALYYPATGIIGELGTIGNGCNYTLPFRVITAKGVDAQEFAQRMNELNLPGVRFRPVYLSPPGGGAQSGVQVYITEPDSAQITEVQFHAADVLARMGCDIFAGAAAGRLNMFDKVCGTKRIRRASPSLLSQWHTSPLPWIESTTKYRLYENK